MRRLLLVLPLLAAPAFAWAAEDAPCPAQQVPLPDNLASFANPASFTGDATMVTTGLAVKLKLAPIETVTDLADKEPKPGTFAGRATLVVTEAGSYGIAASAGAWLNVLDQGAVLTSSDHERVTCSPVHKIVYYDLKPGLYGLEVSNAPADSLTVLLFKKP